MLRPLPTQCRAWTERSTGAKTHGDAVRQLLSTSILHTAAHCICEIPREVPPLIPISWTGELKPQGEEKRACSSNQQCKQLDSILP